MSRRHRRRPKKSGPVGGGKTPCGYCYYHHATLSPRQLKNHKCLQKGCTRLKRFPEHPFWALREHNREHRRAKRRGEATEEGESMGGPNYLLQKQADAQNRAMHTAELLARQFDLDTLDIVLHREFGWGYDRLQQLNDAWASTRREFRRALDPADPECDVVQEHLDDALRDICKGHQEIIPFKERYPELKEVRYDRKVRTHKK